MQVSLRLREARLLTPADMELPVRVLSGRRTLPGAPPSCAPSHPPTCPGGRLHPGRAGLPLSTHRPLGTSEPPGHGGHLPSPALPSSSSRFTRNHSRKSANGRIWVSYVRLLKYFELEGPLWICAT